MLTPPADVAGKQRRDTPMTNDTGNTAAKEGSALAALATACNKVSNSGSLANHAALAAALAAELGISQSVGAALVSAFERAAEYALSTPSEAQDALDEEAAANIACRKAFAPVLQARLQAQLDDLDTASQGCAKCPSCENVGKSEGRVERAWQSTLGPLRLTRRWSHCAECDKGFSRSQLWLRLPDGDFTASLAEGATRLATAVPHGMAVELMGKLLGIGLSAHAVQNETEARALRVTALADAQAEQQRPWTAKGLERQVPRPLDAVKNPPKIAYIEVDGVYVMTRQERPDDRVPAPDKARGGKGRRYTLEGKEVKNAVLYRGDDCAEESDSRGCILQKKYVSHLGNNKDFMDLLWVELRRQRMDEAELLVLLSDGAEWIRQLPEAMPCKQKVLLILDLFHAKHRIWEVARSLHGDKTPEAKAWADEQCLRVEAGEVDAVITALRFLKPRGQDKVKAVEELATYFSNNRTRMDYPAYRARGIRVTSGTVESANYHVTGARLKLQGMRWSIAGAAQMARLRADLFNGRWERRTREIMAA